MTGGGTGGHIIPNIALIDGLERNHRKSVIAYIGEKNGMEQKMIGDLSSVEFKPIFCGKLRRYFSFQNFFDLFKIPVGILQSYFFVKKFKPNVVFCKGGYVSLHAAIGAWIAGAKVVLHESDVSPGLANKIAARFADKILLASEESKKYFKHGIVTGNPVRSQLKDGDAKEGKAFCGIENHLPTILCMGGSSGAEIINSVIRENLDSLLSHYNVVHICGAGNKTPTKFEGHPGKYIQFEFVKDELRHIYAISDLIISRAGAMSLAEFGYLGKKVLLIPLSKKASRGDQIINAKYFAKTNPAIVLEEENFNDETLKNAILDLEKMHMKKQEVNDSKSATEQIINILFEYENRS